jgi:hypothetical protein
MPRKKNSSQPRHLFPTTLQLQSRTRPQLLRPIQYSIIETHNSRPTIMAPSLISTKVSKKTAKSAPTKVKTKKSSSSAQLSTEYIQDSDDEEEQKNLGDLRSNPLSAKATPVKSKANGKTKNTVAPNNTKEESEEESDDTSDGSSGEEEEDEGKDEEEDSESEGEVGDGVEEDVESNSDEEEEEEEDSDTASAKKAKSAAEAPR